MKDHCFSFDFVSHWFSIPNQILYLHQISNGVQLSTPKHIDRLSSRRNSTIISSISNSGGNQYQMTCLRCGEKSTTNTAFIEHYRTKHMMKNDDIFHCQSCSMAFLSPHNFIAHLRDKHQRYHSHACELCDKRFILNADLEKHLVTHNIERPTTSKSSKNSYKLTINLATSKEATQQSVRRYACYLCQKGFERKFKLKSHMKMHTRTKLYTCYLCEKSFRQPSNLEAHRMMCRLDLSLLLHT